MNSEIILLEDGWNTLKNEGISKLEYFLDNGQMPDAMTDAGEQQKTVRVFAPEEYSNLYTLVYKMCTQKQPFNWSEKLYVRYSESVSYYVQQKVLPALTEKKGVALLLELKKRWRNHKLYIKWMDKFFQYLDRYYVRVRSAETVSAKGLNIFKSLIFDEISSEATKALLNVINEEREGRKVEEDILKTVVEMYIELQVYSREFEEMLLPATAAFYAKQSRVWMESLDLPDYLVQAEKSLKSEELRVGRYLHQSSLSKLRGVTIMQLLQEPQKELLSKPTNVVVLLQQDRLEDLERAYRMFALVDGGLTPVASAFRQFVTGKGSALVESREELLRNMTRNEALGDASFVTALIELHDKYKSVVAQCFNSDTAFQKSLKEAFEVFVNKDFEKVSMAALMSSFCDKLLRKSGSAQDVESAIVRLVDLFSFLSDKDDFAEIYRNQLSKRILAESSAREEAEKSLIQKLKMKCGASFTSKLEGMMADLSLAADMQRDFREIPSSGGSTTFEFSATVLTTGFWPSYTAVDAALSSEMELGLASFKQFYSKRTQHRRLTWIHSLSTATVAARFCDSKRFDLVMNTYQALILLCFNDSAALTVEQICSITKLEDGFAKKLLATLIFSKFKVLNKSSQSSDERTIESSDLISVNEAFAVPTRKVRIPPPMAGTEETHNKSKVEEDRSFSIEAAIVRVMKTKKFLQHQQLVAEVVEQLTLFKPNPKSIKQRIENLIEREFIERDPESPNLYKYLA